MKIAICFTGTADGIGAHHIKHGGRRDCLTSWPSILKHVYQDHDCDTFFHAGLYDEETEDKLCVLLKPKAYIAEPMRDFHEDARWNEVNLYKHLKDNKQSNMHDNLSQLYSRSTAIKLALESSKKENIEYDYIITLRYGIHFSKDIQYDTLSKDVCYWAGWNKSFTGWSEMPPQDLFFVGSQSIMSTVSEMYDFINEKVINENYDIKYDMHRYAYKFFFDQKSLPNSPHLDRALGDYTLVRYLDKGLISKLQSDFKVLLKNAQDTVDIDEFKTRKQN